MSIPHGYWRQVKQENDVDNTSAYCLPFHIRVITRMALDYGVDNTQCAPSKSRV